MKNLRGKNARYINRFAFFSHPDYTVGSGICRETSPDQPLARVADYTAGGESHPAPKNHS